MRIEDALRLAMQHFNGGRAEQGAALCREILRALPDNPVANALLARHLNRTGESREALSHAETALRAAPDYPVAHDLKARILAEDPDTEVTVAEAALKRALILSPAASASWFALGNLHQARRDDPDAAIAPYRRALAIAPKDHACRMNLATAQLKLRRPDEAEASCEATLALNPLHIRALAFKSVTRAALGDPSETERLVGWETLTRPMRLPVPDGFSDIAQFNAAFERAIRAHPNLRHEWDPNRRAIRGGAVVTDLLKSDDAAIRGFQAALDRAVETYARDLPPLADHPHIRGRPGGYAIDCWANILAEQGHQTGHIHNLGWLSGVYYVTMPPSVRDEDPEQAGWIEFNRPGYGIPSYDEIPLRSLKPEEGLLVLFPSYVWHRTIPFSGTGERISVAFDLHPR